MTRNSAAWVELLNEADVPCGPIYRIDEVFSNPQVQSLGMAWPVTHPRLGATEVLGQGVRLQRSGPRATTPTPTPDAGRHTDEVLRELGLDDGRIAELRAAGAI
jgi:crotonobetainyl-CoA:carnitine CoA-transferase CaiB-like acyl-CoA transferase